MRYRATDMLKYFTYVARVRECGCCMGMTVDYADERTATYVADFIASGMYVERLSPEQLSQVMAEPTFFKCPHGQLPLPMATEDEEDGK